MSGAALTVFTLGASRARTLPLICSDPPLSPLLSDLHSPSESDATPCPRRYFRSSIRAPRKSKSAHTRVDVGLYGDASSDRRSVSTSPLIASRSLTRVFRCCGAHVCRLPLLAMHSSGARAEIFGRPRAASTLIAIRSFTASMHSCATAPHVL